MKIDSPTTHIKTFHNIAFSYSNNNGKNKININIIYYHDFTISIKQYQTYLPQQLYVNSAEVYMCYL